MQVAKPMLLPSHASTPVSIAPSPQRAFWQIDVQASVSIVLPSSHCSPESMWPLPHCVRFDELPPHAVRATASTKYPYQANGRRRR